MTGQQKSQRLWAVHERSLPLTKAVFELRHDEVRAALARTDGYVPLVPDLRLTGFEEGGVPGAREIRFLLTAARKLDYSHVLLEKVRSTSTSLKAEGEIVLIQLPRMIDLVGKFSQGRAEAEDRDWHDLPPGTDEAIRHLRNAFEHVEARAGVNPLRLHTGRE